MNDLIGQSGVHIFIFKKRRKMLKINNFCQESGGNVVGESSFR